MLITSYFRHFEKAKLEIAYHTVIKYLMFDSGLQMIQIKFFSTHPYYSTAKKILNIYKDDNAAKNSLTCS